MYFDYTKTWNARPDIKKTLANFKTHFSEAQEELNLQQQTTQSSGYHAANNVLKKSIDNLAIKATMDCAALQELTNTIFSLTNHLQEKAQANTVQQLIPEILTPALLAPYYDPNVQQQQFCQLANNAISNGNQNTQQQWQQQQNCQNWNNPNAQNTWNNAQNNNNPRNWNMKKSQIWNSNNKQVNWNSNNNNNWNNNHNNNT